MASGAPRGREAEGAEGPQEAAHSVAVQRGVAHHLGPSKVEMELMVKMGVFLSGFQDSSGIFSGFGVAQPPKTSENMGNLSPRARQPGRRACNS